MPIKLFLRLMFLYQQLIVFPIWTIYRLTITGQLAVLVRGQNGIYQQVSNKLCKIQWEEGVTVKLEMGQPFSNAS